MLRRNTIVGVFRGVMMAVLVCWWLGYGGDRVHAQSLPPAEDSRQSVLREAMLGILSSRTRTEPRLGSFASGALSVAPGNCHDPPDVDLIGDE